MAKKRSTELGLYATPSGYRGGMYAKVPASAHDPGQVSELGLFGISSPVHTIVSKFVAIETAVDIILTFGDAYVQEKTNETEIVFTFGSLFRPGKVGVSTHEGTATVTAEAITSATPEFDVELGVANLTAATTLTATPSLEISNSLSLVGSGTLTMKSDLWIGALGDGAVWVTSGSETSVWVTEKPQTETWVASSAESSAWTPEKDEAGSWVTEKEGSNYG